MVGAGGRVPCSEVTVGGVGQCHTRKVTPIYSPPPPSSAAGPWGHAYGTGGGRGEVRGRRLGAGQSRQHGGPSEFRALERSATGLEGREQRGDVSEGEQPPTTALEVALPTLGPTASMALQGQGHTTP